MDTYKFHPLGQIAAPWGGFRSGGPCWSGEHWNSFAQSQSESGLHTSANWVTSKELLANIWPTSVEALWPPYGLCNMGTSYSRSSHGSPASRLACLLAAKKLKNLRLTGQVIQNLFFENKVPWRAGAILEEVLPLPWQGMPLLWYCFFYDGMECLFYSARYDIYAHDLKSRERMFSHQNPCCIHMQVYADVIWFHGWPRLN